MSKFFKIKQASEQTGVHLETIRYYEKQGLTDNAYKFWRQCQREGVSKKVYLVKGDSTKRQKLITKTYPDNTSRSDRHSSARGDVPLYLLQTDYLKDRINNALARQTEGANYIHFPRWLGEWFNQGEPVQAEVSTKQKGDQLEITLELMKTIARNEANQVIQTNFRAGGAFS